MRRAVSAHRRSVLVVGISLVVWFAVAAALLVTGALREPIKPQSTPSVTVAPSSSPSPTISATPTVRPTGTPTGTATATTSPSATPTPAATPRPTPAPAPSRTLPASLLGLEWYVLPTSRHIVALTFDAGSGDQGLSRILKTLADKNVPGTFFLTGQFIQQYPAEARAIAAVDLHSIGNHTVDHPHMNQLTDAQVRDEILGAERSIVGATGRDPWPLFRFPYGESSARTVGIANALGYGSIRWTIDTLGWEGTQRAGGAAGGQTVQSVTNRTLSAAKPGEIVLMHIGAAPDGTTLDADALAGVIDGLRAKGYSFVAIWDFIEGLS
jgi:peptidoglycan/xylan/chitin deacetylase (PgdA/CDA1 family)